MTAARALLIALVTSAWVASLAVAADQPLPQHVKPNVVVIYADDLGYGDVRCYNPDRGKIPTPWLDRLAAEGMRFTDAHSSSGVCSPSRYTLLTGRYHWRSRLQRGIVGQWEEPLIAADRLTLGTLAKEHGYHTACIGKWHLGWDWPIPPDQRAVFTEKKPADAATEERQRALWATVFAKPIAAGPTTRGFDLYFGTDVPNWPPFCFIEGDRTVGIPTVRLKAGPGLEGWTFEPILPTLADRACSFIGEQARQGDPFLLYMPLTSPHTPIVPNAEWQGKSGLNAYADFVMETDAVVGRVMEALERSGVADRTLVVFSSDNGCAPAANIDALERQGHFPSGPLRGHKADAWEGGHRVPFIVRWPGVVGPGTTCDALVHQADLLRTFADILGASLPESAGEDSVSLLPLFRGDARPVREHAVSASSQGVPALRSGSWKYIPASGSGGWSKRGDPAQPVQLYDLSTDVGETTNLASAQPDRLATMQALLEQLIVAGRSTPGAPQQNDVEVVRYPSSDAPKPAARKFSARESDSRLRAEGDGWGLEKARIDDPMRPRVLLIGDSILGGYHKHVIAALDGKAYVDVWQNPHWQSEKTNRVLAEVLGEGPYDVVHANMGLHGWPAGRIKEGTFAPLTKAYIDVIRTKLPKSKIIWANSTPVRTKDKPSELDPVINANILEQNRMSAEVMAEMNVPVNDFYALLENRLDLAKPDQFHWTPPAYQILGEAATWSIEEALAAAPKPPVKSNIVLIIADDCTYRDLEIYGGQAHSPHLKALAAEGMTLRRCFQAAPMCSPTRHSLYTGIYPVKNGAYPNHAQAYPWVKSIAHYLQAGGYETYLSGKTHVLPKSVFPFKYSALKNDLDPQAIDKAIGECVADRKPFLVIAASTEPHSPWDKGDPSAYPPDSLTLPPILVDSLATRDAYSRYLAEVTYFDAQVGEVLGVLDKHGQRNNTLVIVLSEQGNSLPFAKWTCYDAGLQSACVVRWPGRVKPGSSSDALVEYVDMVPTMLEAAGLSQPEILDGKSFVGVLEGTAMRHKDCVFGLQTTRGIIHGSDFFAIRSARSEQYLYIRNLTPEAEFQNIETRSSMFREWRRLAASGDQQAATLVHDYQHRPAEELYDCEADPWNRTNLITNPALAGVRDTLRLRLEAWMKQQGDQGQPIELDAIKLQRPTRQKGHTADGHD